MSNSFKSNIISMITIAMTLLFIGCQYQPKIINRAAIDVGSGSIKVTVAQVNPRFQQIYATLYSKEHPVPLKRDIQVGGKSELSNKIQNIAINTLSEIQQEFGDQPIAWKGVATAASRQAINAQQMYDRISEQLGMDITIISQEDEGRLGFATAAAVSRINPEKLIAVDSGSGSFQLTTLINGTLAVVEGELGYIPSLEMLMHIRHQELDLQTPPAPVELEEAKLLVEMMLAKMPPISDAFLNKINAPSSSIIGIGNENFIFAMGATGVGKKTFTKEELWQAIIRLAGKPESEMQEFAKPNTALLGMVLLYSIMDAMHLNQITAYHANGVCEGILVDPIIWSVQP